MTDEPESEAERLMPEIHRELTEAVAEAEARLAEIRTEREAFSAPGSAKSDLVGRTKCRIGRGSSWRRRCSGGIDQVQRVPDGCSPRAGKPPLGARREHTGSPLQLARRRATESVKDRRRLAVVQDPDFQAALRLGARDGPLRLQRHPGVNLSTARMAAPRDRDAIYNDEHVEAVFLDLNLRPSRRIVIDRAFHRGLSTQMHAVGCVQRER